MATLGISESHYIDQMVIRCIAIKHRCFKWPYQLLRIPSPKPNFQASAMRWLLWSNIYIYIYICVCVSVFSCGRKAACIRNCKCKNEGLKCINMWSGCGGRTCNNRDLKDDVQTFPVLHARNVPTLFDFNGFSESHIHTQSSTPLPWGGDHHHGT